MLESQVSWLTNLVPAYFLTGEPPKPAALKAWKSGWKRDKQRVVPGTYAEDEASKEASTRFVDEVLAATESAPLTVVLTDQNDRPRVVTQQINVSAGNKNGWQVNQ